MAKKVVIFGTEKMAQLVHFYVTKDSPYEVAAFTVDEEYITERSFMDLPVVPFETVERYYPPDDYMMFVALGYKRLNTLRADKYMAAKKKGYKFISYLSSKATHWGDTEIGENTFILENQVIQPWVKIGNNVVIWSGNHFGHDVVVEDHCWIASHVVACGGVKIEPYCFIGVNATIRDNATVGRECIVGAGALILKDTKPKEVYVAKQTELFRLNSEYFERMMEISG